VSRLPRPTREQVDDEILDAAAVLFARHGFAQTSVQRIADAVGYSKTGLLHRFSTKEALHEATLNRALDQVEELAAGVGHLPPGPGRDRAVLAALTDVALRRPGFVGVVLSSLNAEADSATGEQLDAIALTLFWAFATDPDADPARTLRLVVALGGLAVGTLACRPEAPVPGARDLIAAAAHDALGHARTPEEN